MRNSDSDVIAAMLDWHAAGRASALATVVRTFGASPRPPGSLLAIRDDGGMVGSVSGGCVDARVRERVLARVDTRPCLLRFGATATDRERLQLPCGSHIEVLLEPAPPRASLERLDALLRSRRRARRTVRLADGDVQVEPTPDAPMVVCDDAELQCVHGPARRLLLIGANDVARCVAQFALALDYEVLVCDPRAEYAEVWPLSLAPLTREMPDDAVRAFARDAHTAVIALTHDPRLDDLALLDALPSPAFYVGAIGAKANNAKRRARLLTLGLAPSDLARLHGPVGLAIGSRTPAEIAVSILAELTAVRAHERGATSLAPARRELGMRPTVGAC